MHYNDCDLLSWYHDFRYFLNLKALVASREIIFVRDQPSVLAADLIDSPPSVIKQQQIRGTHTMGTARLLCHPVRLTSHPVFFYVLRLSSKSLDHLQSPAS